MIISKSWRVITGVKASVIIGIRVSVFKTKRGSMNTWVRVITW